MKKVLLFICLLFTVTSAYSQTKLEPKVSIEETSLSKNQMWNNVRRTIAILFPKNAVTYENKEDGIIVLKWENSIAVTSEAIKATALGTIQVDIRDNKFRITKYNENVALSANNLTSSELNRLSTKSIDRMINELEFLSNRIMLKGNNLFSIDEIFSMSAVPYYDVYKSYINISNNYIKQLKEGMIYVDDF